MLPRQVSYQFTDPGGMEGLFGLGRKPEPGNWYRLHATIANRRWLATIPRGSLMVSGRGWLPGFKSSILHESD
ncbi:unnamed protein product [Heligmosomoides polygyrus]|uniref:Calpain catalytic domain-containing protein n=1 Tax=Heligmosomoides polygyrus TaxID=6339 RepID=A0A183GFN4_HELPZ|nr:unnamed protein product [Heligmosomoides polygyrus]